MCVSTTNYEVPKFDCPHCELDELRERVDWMMECDAISLMDMYFDEFTYRSNKDAESAIDEMRSILNRASKAVEELL